MTKPFNVLYNDANDILVLAGAFVWDAMAEDCLRASASHGDKLDELAGAHVLLEGLVTRTLLILKLGLAIDVARRDEEVIQPYQWCAGLFSRWVMLVLEAASSDAKSAPVPVRDMTAAPVLLRGLC